MNEKAIFADIANDVGLEGDRSYIKMHFVQLTKKCICI